VVSVLFQSPAVGLLVASWVTLTTEGAQASTGAITSNHSHVPHPSHG